MAELRIEWSSAERVSKEDKAVVTGESADEATEGESNSPLLWTDRPIIVYVCDEAAGCEGFDKLEEVVLKDEKIGLGMKAFRRVKMHPDDVAADDFLKDHGKQVPRMLLIEPTKLKVTVLEKNKLKTSKLYSAMKSVSDKFFKQKLDKTVKAHLKLLTEQDQLANQQKTLQAKLARLGSDAKKRDIEKVESEVETVREALAEIREKTKALWDFTPKGKKA